MNHRTDRELTWSKAVPRFDQLILQVEKCICEWSTYNVNEVQIENYFQSVITSRLLFGRSKWNREMATGTSSNRLRNKYCINIIVTVIISSYSYYRWLIIIYNVFHYIHLERAYNYRFPVYEQPKSLIRPWTPHNFKAYGWADLEKDWSFFGTTLCRRRWQNISYLAWHNSRRGAHIWAVRIYLSLSGCNVLILAHFRRKDTATRLGEKFNRIFTERGIDFFDHIVDRAGYTHNGGDIEMGDAKDSVKEVDLELSKSTAQQHMTHETLFEMRTEIIPQLQ